MASRLSQHLQAALQVSSPFSSSLFISPSPSLLPPVPYSPFPSSPH